MTWIERNRNSIIRNSFLLPILLVVIMSISHVVSWYDLGNPLSWAIYLSVAVEIFALASVSAATVKINRGSIWFLFGLVTFIQIIGNVFFEYKDIDPNAIDFKSWVELLTPLVPDWSIIDHRRILALVQGGTLPIMSLTALHYYIKFTDGLKNEEIVKEAKKIEIDQVWEKVKEYRKNNPIDESDLEDEPTALANSQYREQYENEKSEPGDSESDKNDNSYDAASTEDITYTEDELSEAKTIWSKLKKSFKGTKASDLISFYRRYKTGKDIDTNTGKLKKI